MARNLRTFILFMERNFYDREHLEIFLKASGYGFSDEPEAVFQLGYTRAEFDDAYAVRRTRLPNGDRIAWSKFSRKNSLRLEKIRHQPFGYQVNLKVMAEHPAINFLLYAPSSEFDEPRPFWWITGVDWGNSIAIIYGTGTLYNWLKRCWTDEYDMRFGIGWKGMFDYLVKNSAENSFRQMVATFPVYKM